MPRVKCDNILVFFHICGNNAVGYFSFCTGLLHGSGHNYIFVVIGKLLSIVVFAVGKLIAKLFGKIFFGKAEIFKQSVVHGLHGKGFVRALFYGAWAAIEGIHIRGIEIYIKPRPHAGAHKAVIVYIVRVEK